nr:DNA primase [uncultured Flavobacterium sp.]
MKRVIVDYAKLTNEILSLLVEKFPDGYDDSDIIRFKNAKNETIEAVEVRTEDTIYLVKVSTKLADRIENFDDEEDDVLPVDAIPAVAIKDIDLDEDEDEDEEPLNKNRDDDGDDDEDEDEAEEPIDEDFEEDED